MTEFPLPAELVAALLVGGLALFLAGTAALAWSRRKRGLGRRARGERETVGALLREAGLPEGDLALLDALVLRHAASSPLRAVTTREGFDALVARAMDEAARPARKTRRRDAAATLGVDDIGARLRAIRAALKLDHVPVGQGMASTRDLAEGQWLSIARADDGPAHWFRVMIEDLSEANFRVAYKDGPAASAPELPVGAPLRCALWRGEDGRYSFESRVEAFDSPPPVWTLAHTAALQRTQARAHFRVRHEQDVVAEVLNAPLGAPGPASLVARPAITTIPGRVTSLSAGGCAIVFKQSVARRVLLRLPLEIPGARPLEVVVEIVATAHISGGRHLVRGKFLGLAEDAQDTIARHVHRKQQPRLGAPPASTKDHTR